MILQHPQPIDTFWQFLYCVLRGAIHGGVVYSIQVNGKWHSVGFRKAYGIFNVIPIGRPPKGEIVQGEASKWLLRAKRKEGQRWVPFFNDCNSRI